MKNAIVLLTLALLFSPSNISGQEVPDTNVNKPDKSTWSVSISYSPHFTFSFDPSATYQHYKIFLSGFNVRVDRKPDSGRVSVSLGFNVRYKTIDYSNPARTENVTFLEFPVQVDYHLKKSANRFDPYLKTSLRICYFKSEFNHDRQPDDPFANNIISDYLPLVDIGIGSFIRITDRMYLLLESDIGYGLTKLLPNRVYADLMIGIKFNL
jgi:hypothetical protein